MEESRDLLMSTLVETGVFIPGDITSVMDFTSEALVSICSQLLNLIDPSSSFCHEFPDSLPERFKICTDIALSVKNLGYIGDISYYKFLHPSEDDSYRLVRFLVERLSDQNEGIKTSPARRPKVEIFRSFSDDRMLKEDNDETFDIHIQKVEAVLKDLNFTSEKNTSPNIGSTIVDPLSLRTDGSSDLSLGQLPGYEGKSSADLSESNYETLELQNQHDLLLHELESGSSELYSLESELELLTMAEEKFLNDKQPGGSYLGQLNQQLVVRRCNIMDLKKQWDSVRLTLETKKLQLLDQLYVEEPEGKEKILKLKKTELNLHSLSSEIQKRNEELYNLYNEVERQPKAGPRKSYIHGIKEITRNSCKLDTDIQRISGETREVQLESNTIQERLHRSYAVVDEMVTRELKKDPSVREVYKLVTSIHSIFEQISEKILMSDRFRRETVEYEKKVGFIRARGMSVEKLQADLEAMKKVNESLEK